MIEATGLTRRFGAFTAVSGLSLRVETGHILALLGPNGAGKTTTIRMLAALLAPSEGEARVAGFDVRRQGTQVRASIGLVTDAPGLYEQMPVYDYLDMFGTIYGMSPAERRRRIAELLAFFDLEPHHGQRMVGFSKGMKQKVALARALMHEPPVLFLDEPTAGLDPMAARSVRELILGLKRSFRAIVLCTHDLDEAERLADAVAILRAGQIVALDTPAALRAQRAENASGTLVRILLGGRNVSDPATLASLIDGAAPEIVDLQRSGPGAAPGRHRTGVPDLHPALRQPASDRPAGLGRGGGGVGVLRSPKPGGCLCLGDGRRHAGRRDKERDMNGEPRVAHPLRIAWVIARRHIKESLRNRSTYVMAGFYLLLPLALVLFTLQPILSQPADSPAGRQAGGTMAVYLLMAGLLPCTWSVGIAAGAFAAEKEQGSLVPLLATPASNNSIFAGKVIGAVLPSLTLAAVGVFGYLTEIALLFGPDTLRLMPPLLAALILALLPGVSLLGAGISSMISARVNTEQVANQYGSIILTLIWLALFLVVLRVLAWGIWPFAIAVVAVFVIAVALVVVSAATWRREEVMARQ